MTSAVSTDSAVPLTPDDVAEPGPEARPAGPVTTCAVVAQRTIRKFVRTPQLMVIGTIQSAMFLFIFRYAFGGAIDTGTVPYVQFLVPGYLVSGVLFSGAGAAAGVAEDIEHGFSDRLRSLPVARTALLAGRSVADTALLSWGLVVATAIAFAVGFRIDGSVPPAVAAWGLCVVYGAAFTWVFIAIGTFAGTAQAAAGMSMLVFPLTAVSSAYVPVATMPGWMQPIAEHQPITAMTNAVRSLVLGDLSAAGLDHGAGHWVLVSLAWCAGLVVVFAPLSVSRYRRS
jgi:ABC transporter DrrB family efflux protein